MPKVKMPLIGLSDDASILSEWKVKEGDYVKEGQCLFVTETNKASYEINSEHDGYVCKLYYEDGDEVAVNETVCVIEENLEDYVPEEISEEEKVANDEVVVSGEKSIPHKEEVRYDEKQSNEYVNTGEFHISPRAKQKALDLKVDYTKAIPSGAENRIIERDIDELVRKIRSGEYVENSVSSSSEVNSSTGSRREDCSRLRKQIAKNMQYSMTSMAQITIESSFDASNILEFKKLEGSKGNKYTINDIVLYVVARTVVKHKYVNAHYYGDYFELFDNANLGVAVNTDKGLFVPTIFNAQELSMQEISTTIKTSAKKCLNGTIQAKEMSNGTFTISNLGKYGIEHSMPIINPPQTCILGLNTINYKIKKENNGFSVYPAINLSLTFNHMALDGVPASEFLQELCNALADFTY